MPDHDRRERVPPDALARNSLLGSLSRESLTEAHRHGSLFAARRRQVLFAPQADHDALFPLSGLVALQRTDASGGAMTIDVVGHEGIVGLWLYLDPEPAPYLGLALTDLVAWRMSGSAIREIARSEHRVANVLHRYAQAQLEVRATLIHCARAHPVHARVARFLADCAMRIHASALAVAHEDIAQAVGAHRPAVTEALHRLRGSGAVWIGRGVVSVADMEALRSAACECLATIVQLYRRLHPRSHATPSERTSG